MMRNIVVGIEAGHADIGRARCSAPSRFMMQPAQWNSGMIEVQRSPGARPSRVAAPNALIIIAR